MSEMDSQSMDLQHAAAHDTCVLLSGDPQASTPLAYRFHRLSNRRDGEFIVIDCGSAAPVVEARLDECFAAAEAAARACTVFLKDVGRLEPWLQRKLADALARRAQRPWGMRQRVIASTDESLACRVREGTFNDTLFYRLNVIHVVLPSGGRKVSGPPPRRGGRGRPSCNLRS